MLLCVEDKKGKLIYFLDGHRVEGEALDKARGSYTVKYLGKTESIKPPIDMKKYDEMCERHTPPEPEPYDQNRIIGVMLMACLGGSIIFFIVLIIKTVIEISKII